MLLPGLPKFEMPKLESDAATRERVARRIFHATFVPLFFVYYLIPDRVYLYDTERLFGFVTCLACICMFEYTRRRLNWQFFMLRRYENIPPTYYVWARPASYVWAAIAIFIAIVFFPIYFAVPVLLCMAWVDPLLGELRTRKVRHPWLIGTVVYFGIMFPLLYVLALLFRTPPYDPLHAAGFSVLAAAASILAEGPNIKWLDDDLTMTILPLLVLCVLG